MGIDDSGSDHQLKMTIVVPVIMFVVAPSLEL